MDRNEVKQTVIEVLMAEINKAVYDLFDLTEEEYTLIEEYLEMF